MSTIIYNKKLTEEYYLIKIKQENKAKMGQFYMVRAWDNDPLLSRALSVFDRDEETVTFLYRLVGKGTNILSTLKQGEDITCQGPNGNPFPYVKGKVAMIGGGVGIAPLYLAAKEIKKDSNNKVDIFFCLFGEEILRNELESVSDNLVLKTNQQLLHLVNFEEYDYVFTCGPEGLMENVYLGTENTSTIVYASLEKNMACGIGVCYGCTFKTHSGYKLACKDGPVYLGSEVFNYE